MKPLRLLFPRSLRHQLLIRSLVILAALLLSIGGLQFVIMKEFVYQNRAETLSAQARAFLRDPMVRDLASEQTAPRRLVLFVPDTSIAIIREDGTFTDLSSEQGTAAPRLAEEEYERIRERIARREPVRYVVAADAFAEEQLLVFRPLLSRSHPNALLQVGTLTAPLKAILLRQLMIFAGLAFVALAAGVALYLQVLNRSLRPLAQVVKTAERTDAGNLDERAPVRQGQLEIDRLAESFNGMLDRLKQSIETERAAKERMRRLIADASHELRTPLTAVHGFLEVLLRGAADHPEQRQMALRSMLGEAKRMKKLVEDLLLLAKLDRAPEMRWTEARLDALLVEMEPHLRVLAGERAVRFEIEPDVVCRFDPDRIKQVVLNLAQNAIQHTDAKLGTISFRLYRQGDEAILEVGDNGAGIGKEHLPFIFERFYRIDPSRSRQLGGTGLGLSISQSIVEAHGGVIEVESEEGKGSVFRVRLPAIR